MDELELLYELNDRHQDHLVYTGEYRLLGISWDTYRPLQGLFEDWRQRIYRFENDLGASVVFYQSLGRSRMDFDLVLAKFTGGDAFDFHYADKVNSRLRWRDIQKLLDHIKIKTR